MPHINFPFLGNSLVMALVIVVHVFFAFVAVGGTCLAFVSEWIGYKKNSAFHDRFARGYIKFLSDMMKLNGVLGVTFVVLLIGLFPEFATRLYNIFFWPLVLEAAIFMVMMASTAAYGNTWETMSNKGGHILIGAVAAASGVSAGLVINAAWSFMLTPGTYFQDPRLMNAVFNPSFLASSTHVILPCIINSAMFGYIYAFSKQRKAAAADAAYYSWMLDYCGTIFAFGILLQPLSGLSYLFTLKAVNVLIFDTIVKGVIAKFFWTMASLATVAVSCSAVYLLSNKKKRTVLLVGGIAVLTAFSFGAYTRERARKPFVIYGNMYMTGALVAAPKPAVETPPAPAAAPAKTAPAKSAAKTAALTPAAARHITEEALEAHGCLACHSYYGDGGTFGPALDVHLPHHTKDDLKRLLRKPAETMPPFDGTDAELDEFVNRLKPE
ncbi:MAG: cytochrome ubiquinol oxidase subunit I [Elusimicrobiales bacterium]|nr:cytochrome ubiquinol oxidase subunit I [Elusimicrobiales bacterium]